MVKLALVRHGESEWNAKNIWTGWTDIPLSENGRQEARLVAEKLKDTKWDYVFESDLSRAKQTTDEILTFLNSPTTTRIVSPALRERDYGIYTGKNKLEIEKQVGESQYLSIRRGWDVQIPQGESLKDVYGRAVPYFEKEILPKLKEGKNIIISAHGNSLRALVKYLDKIPDDQIQNFEIPTGEVRLYSFDNDFPKLLTS